MIRGEGEDVASLRRSALLVTLLVAVMQVHRNTRIKLAVEKGFDLPHDERISESQHIKLYVSIIRREKYMLRKYDIKINIAGISLFAVSKKGHSKLYRLAIFLKK